MPFVRSLAALSAAAVVAGAGQAQAGIIRTGTTGELQASAEFNVIGNDLVVRLSNTSFADVAVPAHILTGVFFDIDGGGVSLAPVSGQLPEGSVVHFGPDGGGDVGGEWAYRSGLVGAPYGASYGISSAGFGLFGPADRFPGADLDPPASPNGMNYGILSLGDNPNVGNAAVTGDFPLIQHEVVFTLSGLPANFDLERISRLSFQYGTNLSEPNITTFDVPAPAGAGILALGGLALRRRRR
jgi:hypothetical protein